MREDTFLAGFFEHLAECPEEVVIPPGDDCAGILVAPDRILLLAVSTFGEIAAAEGQAPSWHTAESGLFSDRPYVCCQEAFWSPDAGARTDRFHVIDAATAHVTVYTCSHQAYTDDAYRDMLREAGFDQIELLPAMAGMGQDIGAGLTILARNPG